MLQTLALPTATSWRVDEKCLQTFCLHSADEFIKAKSAGKSTR